MKESQRMERKRELKKVHVCVYDSCSDWLVGVCWQAQQAEAGRRKQEERQRSFQPPVEAKMKTAEGEGGRGGEVDVTEVKRKVKEAMKRRKKK